MDKYIVFGSGPLMIRGLVEGHDLDVFVSDDIFEEYKKKVGWKLNQCKKDYTISKDGIELSKTWKPGEWDLNELINDAEYINDIPFVSLNITKQWKLLKGREKDLNHIKVIDRYLETQ
jgi:hypothetical protein